MTTVEQHDADRRAAIRVACNHQRAGWREAGLCTRCGRPRDGDGMTCAKCRAYAREAARKSREKRRGAGQCYECGKRQAEGPGLRCTTCRERDQAHDRRKANRPRARLARVARWVRRLAATRVRIRGRDGVRVVRTRKRKG